MNGNLGVGGPSRGKSTEELVGEFGTILDALMAPQEEPRQNAEKYLRTLTINQPGDIMMVLALIGAQGVGGFQLDHRFLSLILLKRLAFRAMPGLFLNAQAQVATAPFDVVKEATRGRIESILYSGLRDEMNTRMRKGLGTCVAAWAEESSIRRRPVTPLPPTLMELSQSKHAFHRFTPLQVIAAFPTLLIDSPAEPLQAIQIAAMLLAGLHDPSVDVRVEAIKAVEAVMQGAFLPKDRTQVGPELVEACFTTLTALPIEALQHALLPLVDIAWEYSSVCGPSLNKILDIIVPLLAPPSYNAIQWSSFPPPASDYDDWTQYANSAQEILLALAYYYPSEVRAWHGGRMIEEVLGMMIGRQVAQLVYEGDEQSDWLKEEAVEVGEWPAPEPADTISRLTFTCSHPEIERIMFDRLRACLAIDDWRVVCAGLTCFAPIIPNANLNMASHMQPFFEMSAKCVNHDHFRVRYSFLSCVDDLCHAIRAPVSVTQQVVRLCLERLHDPIQRVRAQAINSLADVLRVMSDDEVRSMDLKGVADALCDAYARSDNFVKDRALVAMGEIETYFLDKPEYISGWSQFLLDVIRGATAPDMRGVVVRAIECVTLPVFLRALCITPSERLKVSQIMHAILLHQNDCTTADDPRTRCIVDAMATLANVTGDAFTPLVPVTVPFIFRLATTTMEQRRGSSSQGIALTQEEDDDTVDFDEYGDLPFDNDRAAALHALATFGVRVPASMGPYVKQGLALGLESTRNPSGSMFGASTFLVASMLHAARLNGIDVDVENLLLTLISRIKSAERGAGTRYSQVHLLFKAWSDCVRIINIPLPDNITCGILEAVQVHIQGLVDAQRRHGAGEVDEDEYDEEEYEEGRGGRLKAEHHRSLEMMKDCLRAVAEVAGLLARAKRGKGEQEQGQVVAQGRGADMAPLSTPGADDATVKAYRLASVPLGDLMGVDAGKLGQEALGKYWSGVLQLVRVTEEQLG